jgi:hypothetical protein
LIRFFGNSTLRETILRKKAEVQAIENTLAACATGWVSVKGQWGRVTPGSMQRLIEKKAHLELQIRESEIEELLQAWHGSSRDPGARTAIEKRLADLGETLRKPTAGSQGVSHRSRQHRTVDKRKELIAKLRREIRPREHAEFANWSTKT